MLICIQAQDSAETLLSNVQMQGDQMTAEIGNQLYKATIVSHLHLDEQVWHMSTSCLIKVDRTLLILGRLLGLHVNTLP